MLAVSQSCIVWLGWQTNTASHREVGAARQALCSVDDEEIVKRCAGSRFALVNAWRSISYSTKFANLSSVSLCCWMLVGTPAAGDTKGGCINSCCCSQTLVPFPGDSSPVVTHPLALLDATTVCEATGSSRDSSLREGAMGRCLSAACRLLASQRARCWGLPGSRVWAAFLDRTMSCWWTSSTRALFRSRCRSPSRQSTAGSTGHAPWWDQVWWLGLCRCCIRLQTPSHWPAQRPRLRCLKRSHFLPPSRSHGPHPSLAAPRRPGPGCCRLQSGLPDARPELLIAVCQSCLKLAHSTRE